MKTVNGIEIKPGDIITEDGHNFLVVLDYKDDEEVLRAVYLGPDTNKTCVVYDINDDGIWENTGIEVIDKLKVSV